MEKKELVAHTKSGRSYSYYPLVQKDKVTESKFKKILTDLFKGNKIEMAAAFVKDTNLSEKELSELIDMLRNERDKC